MKGSSLLSGILALFLTLTPLVIEAQQQLTGYPPIDQPPPIDPKFTALVDLSKAPKAPIRKEPGTPCDGLKDPFCYWSCTGCMAKTDIKVCPQKTDWGITYDDGPSPSTPKVLDYLKAKNIKATFFVVGSRITENPDILKRTVDEGHQIGVHTWSHTPLTTQTNEEVIAEIKWTEKAIKEVVGKVPKLLRPPQGDYDDRIRYIANSLGYTVAIWDLDPNDWMSSVDKTYDLDWITGNFTEWVKTKSPTGHISLEHDLYVQTVSKAPDAIDIVMGAGFNIKTISSCTGTAAFQGDTTNTTTTTSNTTVSTTTSSTTTSSSSVAAASPKSSSSSSGPKYASANNVKSSTPPVSQQSSTNSVNNVPSSNQYSNGSSSLKFDYLIGLGMTTIFMMIASYSHIL